MASGMRKRHNSVGEAPAITGRFVAECEPTNEATTATGVPELEYRTVSSADVSDSVLDSRDSLGKKARDEFGWGVHFVPPNKHSVGRKTFRRLCDDLKIEAERLPCCVENGMLKEEAIGVQAEIFHLLESLFDCDFGEGESLKAVVAVVQSQLNNARWTQHHIDFLIDVINFLRVRSLVDKSTVATCYSLIETHRLDAFRGTVAESPVSKRYRIQEVEADDDDRSLGE